MRDYDVVRNSVEESLKNFKTDYIDLYLIHSPHSKFDKIDGFENNPPYKGEEKTGSDVLEIYKILLEYQKQGIYSYEIYIFFRILIVFYFIYLKGK